MIPAPRTLLSLQYLRAAAALGVVAFHTGWTHTPLGQSGVDLFFVISGFVMVLKSKPNTSPLAFLRARAARIVPPYWLATLAAAALAESFDVPRLLMSLAFWPHDNAQGHPWPVLLQGWTLNFEAFFYLAFAAALMLPARIRLHALTAALGGLVAVGTTLHSPGVIAWTYTNDMMLEFLAGAWLCVAYRKGWMPGPRMAALTGLCGTAALLPWTPSAPPDAWRCLAYGVPMLLIAAAGLGLETHGRLPRLSSLHALGDSSYALYLTHTMVQTALLPLLRPLPAVLAVPAAVAACVAVGLVTHRGIEKPVTDWLRMLPPRRAAIAPRPG